MILAVLLIIVVIVLAIKNNDLNNEIIKLRKEKLKFCPKCGYDLEGSNNRVIVNKPVKVVNNNIVSMCNYCFVF